MKKKLSVLLATLFCLTMLLTACDGLGGGSGPLSGNYEWAPPAFPKEQHLTLQFSGDKAVFKRGDQELKFSYTVEWTDEAAGEGTIVFTPEDASVEDIRFDGERYMDLEEDIEPYNSETVKDGLMIGSVLFTKK